MISGSYRFFTIYLLTNPYRGFCMEVSRDGYVNRQ